MLKTTGAETTLGANELDVAVEGTIELLCFTGNASLVTDMPPASLGRYFNSLFSSTIFVSIQLSQAFYFLCSSSTA